MPAIAIKDNKIMLVDGKIAIGAGCCLSCRQFGNCDFDLAENVSFTDRGFIDGGQNGALRSYALPGAVSHSPWTMLFDDATPTPRCNGFRCSFEDSDDTSPKNTTFEFPDPQGVGGHGNDGANCSNHNPLRQLATVTATFTLSVTTLILITWSGVGEREDPEFELMRLTIDGAKVYLAHAPGGELACAAPAAVVSSPEPPQYLVLLPGTHTIEIEADTADSWFHVGCFYQFLFTCGTCEDSECVDHTISAEFSWEMIECPGELGGCATPDDPVNDCHVQFIDESSTDDPGNCDVVEHFWDFGDGETSTEAEPLHVFDPVQNNWDCWMVTHVVRDECGCTSCVQHPLKCCQCQDEEANNLATLSASVSYEEEIDEFGNCNSVLATLSVSATVACDDGGDDGGPDGICGFFEGGCFEVDWGDGQVSSHDFADSASGSHEFEHEYDCDGDPPIGVYNGTVGFIDSNCCAADSVDFQVPCCSSCSCCFGGIQGLFITLSGKASGEGNCPQCTSLNGTFLAPATGACGGSYVGDSFTCDDGTVITQSVAWSLTCNGAELQLDVTDNDSHRYRKTVLVSEFPADCVALLEGSIPLFFIDPASTCTPGSVSVSFDFG